MGDRVRRLYVAPNGGRAWYDIPKEDEYRLTRLLSTGWRPATTRERVWYYLTRPRFSWLSLLAIFVVADIIWKLLS
jgi:hypothetical protein